VVGCWRGQNSSTSIQMTNYTLLECFAFLFAEKWILSSVLLEGGEETDFLPAKTGKQTCSLFLPCWGCSEFSSKIKFWATCRWWFLSLLPLPLWASFVVWVWALSLPGNCWVREMGNKVKARKMIGAEGGRRGCPYRKYFSLLLSLWLLTRYRQSQTNWKEKVKRE